MTLDTPAAHDALWFGNSRVSIRLPAAAGADAISIIEHWMPYGDSPPLHIHHNEDEVFHVLEGTLRVRVGDAEFLLNAGDIALAPKSVPHTFRVDSSAGAHCLTICRGADFESLVVQASRPALAAGLPPQAAPTPEQITALGTLCAANHIDLIGPPLG